MAGNDTLVQQPYIGELEDRGAQQAEYDPRSAAAEGEHQHDSDLGIANEPEKAATGAKYPEHRLERHRQCRNQPIANKHAMGNRERQQRSAAQAINSARWRRAFRLSQCASAGNTKSDANSSPSPR